MDCWKSEYAASNEALGCPVPAAEAIAQQHGVRPDVRRRVDVRAERPYAAEGRIRTKTSSAGTRRS